MDEFVRFSGMTFLADRFGNGVAEFWHEIPSPDHVRNAGVPVPSCRVGAELADPPRNQLAIGDAFRHWSSVSGLRGAFKPAKIKDRRFGAFKPAFYPVPIPAK
jgi:hypothetical protein